jgi:hypothetical protein
MKKPILIIFGLTLIALCLLVVRTAVSNRIATSGELLSEIMIKTDRYKQQNAIIGEELYASLSFIKLSEKASSLGFIASKNTFSLSQNLPLAVRQ